MLFYTIFVEHIVVSGYHDLLNQIAGTEKYLRLHHVWRPMVVSSTYMCGDQSVV